MNAPFNPVRRGACPSLSAPMQTGDGLLVRLLPAEDGLTPAQLGGLADAAACFGNGILEVTQRGSLQIRGLAPATIGPLNDAVADLGIAIRTGLPVDVSPLAGLDPAELADPRPLAYAIRQGAEALLARLGPKISVVIDGGGSDWLVAVKADIRLTAERDGDGVAWRISLAGDANTAHPLGVYDEPDALAVALSILSAIADSGRDARARDVLALNTLDILCSFTPPSVLRDISPARGEIKPSSPLRENAGLDDVDSRRSLNRRKGDRDWLISPLARETSRRREGGDVGHLLDYSEAEVLRDSRHALPVALAFGFITAPDLAAFARSCAGLGITEIRLAPRNTLILLCASAAIANAARDLARSAGLIASAADPRRAIVACAGAPACASGHYDTRALAARIAAASPAWLDGSFQLHLSGCAKGCALPAGASIALVGGETGAVLVANGTSLPAGLREELAEIQ